MYFLEANICFLRIVLSVFSAFLTPPEIFLLKSGEFVGFCHQAGENHLYHHSNLEISSDNTLSVFQG